MESIVVSWRELLVAGVIILAVYIAEMLLLLRGKKGAATDGALRDELIQLKQRVEALEARSSPAAEAAEEIAGRTEISPYNRAIQMARQGIDAARISERCGISRGEADLIVTMHKQG